MFGLGAFVCKAWDMGLGFRLEGFDGFKGLLGGSGGLRK